MDDKQYPTEPEAIERTEADENTETVESVEAVEGAETVENAGVIEGAETDENAEGIASEETPDAPAAPDAFLQPYVTADLRQAVEQRSAEAPAEEDDLLTLTVRRICKEDRGALNEYVQAENSNPHLEQHRKRYHLMQKLSWAALIVCAAITIAVLICTLTNRTLLQDQTRDVLICAAAVCFAALTWIFSGVGTHCLKRMIEVDLVLRVLQLPAPETPDDVAAEAEIEVETEDALQAADTVSEEPQAADSVTDASPAADSGIEE
jgi:hypothetical protein